MGAKRFNEADEALHLLQLARLCLVASFREDPGTTLCAAVFLASAAQTYGERIRLQEVEKSDRVLATADSFGASVGGLVLTLDESDRERLFRTAAVSAA